jgi:hypothetical protein
MSDPHTFFEQIAVARRKYRNDPKCPGKILLSTFEQEDLSYFLDELYERLNLEMCPRHFTTKLPGNGVEELWKPDWIKKKYQDETKLCICKKE